MGYCRGTKKLEVKVKKIKASKSIKTESCINYAMGNKDENIVQCEEQAVIASKEKNSAHSIANERDRMTSSNIATLMDSPQSATNSLKNNASTGHSFDMDKENMNNRPQIVDKDLTNSGRIKPNTKSLEVDEETHNNDVKLSNGFDNSIRLSENPFDILNGLPFKQSSSRKLESKTEKSKATDDIFLSLLKKNKSSPEEAKAVRKEGIFKKLKIITKRESNFEVKKYYKFPFEIGQINDGSEIFEKIRNGYVCALSSAYANYRKFGESFRVLVNKEIFIFGKTIRCSKTLLKTLKDSEISIDLEHNDYITIDQEDKGLIFDMLVNTEVPRGKCIPFVISEFEFENGIVYRTKIIKGPTVRCFRKGVNAIEYSYCLEGPLISSDFRIDEEAQIEYID